MLYHSIKKGIGMAACDNIYGTFEQWVELFEFLKENKSEYLCYMRTPIADGEVHRICYSAEIQKFLKENFKPDWAQEELDSNFDVQRIILGKTHHEQRE